MEVTVSSIVLSLALVTFLTLAWKALNWVWLRPKQIERCLREQGFKGNPYRFLYGDTKEFISAIMEARSKPMEASDDDIVPRALSFHRHFVNLHGMNYFTWLGPTPRLSITDPKLIKEILSNYEVFQKPAVVKSLLTGIVVHEGEKWAKHRKLVNPAFQLEKLKLMVPAMYSSCSEMISKWEVLVSTKGFCEVDVWPYLSNLTADVISRTAFGSNYEEGKSIFQLLKEQTDIALQRLQSISIPGSSDLNCSLFGFGFFPNTGMECTKLGMVKAKADREVPERARFQRKSLSILVWRHQRVHLSSEEARSKTMEASDDDVVPRVMPFHRYFVNLHGKNYFMWLGPTPRLNITDPKLIKEVLSNYKVFQKPAIIKLLLTGIVVADGEKWVKHRNLVNPAFQLEKLKLMVPAICSSCCEMMSKWEALVSTKGPCELDVWPGLSNLTADVISRTAFGTNYEEGKLIFQLLREQTVLAVQRVQSLNTPGWRFLPTKTKREMKKIYNELGAVLRNMIVKRQRTMNGEDGDHGDLLGMLLTSNLKDIDQEKQGNKKSIKLTIEEVIEECKLFYQAGQETTADLLVWTMVLLSKNQKWQTLAREEILAVFGDNKPDFNSLNQLKTVTMILYEAMRYTHQHPTLFEPWTRRQRKENMFFVLERAFHANYGSHHDPEIWVIYAKEFMQRKRMARAVGASFPSGLALDITSH
ncbi:hypothetical protein Vadar_001394 [Vaccinium darrowii]|uniref:Uncharacterized protein n=1 Tax=Vaccinium darrowii TaxID=229202 RepID=A0ACB7Z0L9_9ERIC|nr:hypothetical protein Vadar_001394 [Vaccinium darrowii]